MKIVHEDCKLEQDKNSTTEQLFFGHSEAWNNILNPYVPGACLKKSLQDISSFWKLELWNRTSTQKNIWRKFVGWILCWYGQHLISWFQEGLFRIAFLLQISSWRSICYGNITRMVVPSWLVEAIERVNQFVHKISSMKCLLNSWYFLEMRHNTVKHDICRSNVGWRL